MKEFKGVKYVEDTKEYLVLEMKEVYKDYYIVCVPEETKIEACGPDTKHKVLALAWTRKAAEEELIRLYNKRIDTALVIRGVDVYLREPARVGEWR